MGFDGWVRYIRLYSRFVGSVGNYHCISVTIVSEYTAYSFIRLYTNI